MALEELQKKQMQQDMNSLLQSQESRLAIRLSSKVGKGLQDDKKEFYSLKAAEQENLKIAKLLQNADELKIEDVDRAKLEVTQNRNENFLFVNQEIWGGDSPLMTDIKRGVSRFENIIHEKFTKSLRNLSKDTQMQARSDLADKASSICENVINDCATYLKRGPSRLFWRKKRYESVRRLKERMSAEKAKLDRIASEEYRKNYVEDLQGTETLKDLLNHTEMRSRRAGRLKKIKDAENEKRNSALKEKANQADALYREQKEKSENIVRDKKKQEKKQTADEDRTLLVVATTMNVMANYNEEETTSFYEKIARNVDKCSEQEKKEKIEAIEKFLETLLAFDITNLNFTKLEDLYNQDFLKNRIILQGGYDCEWLIDEYESMMQKDPKLCNFSKQKLIEAKARRETLTQVASLWINLKEILNSPYSKNMDLDAMLKLSEKDLNGLMDKAMDEGNNELFQFYYQFETIRVCFTNKLTGMRMFGPGMDIADMEKQEQERLKTKYGL